MNVESQSARVRPTLIALVLIGALIAGWWLWREPAPPAAPLQTKRPLPPPPPITAQPRVAPPLVPPANVPLPKSAPRPSLAQQLEVPMQDQATIDFSYGAPMVKSGGSDAEALERSMREINAALKDIAIGPDGKTSPAPTSPPPAR